MVRGEAGLGKTTVLDHARAAASTFQVLHVVGVEAEARFAFAGLHRLCTPVLEHLDALPQPQRVALSVALGRRAGDRPDPFLVGLAVLSLLAEAAEERPLLCVVDDAQWLDTVSSRVIGFVARRLHAEPLALLIGLRDPAPGDAGDPLADLPTLRLRPLPDAAARELLTGRLPEPLDDAVRDRIVAEARGNPLALLELARHAAPADLAGGFGLPDAVSVPDGIEEGIRRRTAALPAPTRLALVVAAAEPTGDPALFWHAAARVGLDPRDVEPAQAAGLLEIDSRVRFAHPLARSAAYRAAPPADRRRAHGAIAAATDAGTDPDRRTWHQAQATVGMDETIAARLQRAASHAQAVGGPAAAAAFLERSAELTPDAAARARRRLDAARAKHEAGASRAALDLVGLAARGMSDQVGRARTELLRAQIVAHMTRGNEAPGLLLDAARLLGPLDATLSRDTYLEALDAAMLAGPLALGRGIAEVAGAATAAPAAATPARPVDLLLDGLVTYYLRGYAESVPALRRAQRAFAVSDDDGPRRRWMAAHTALALWDDLTAGDLAERLVRRTRERGALTTLPFALNLLGAVLVNAGDLGRVADLVDEADGINRATGSVAIPHTRLVLAAWRGDRDEVTALRTASLRDATRRGEGTAVTIADHGLAVLHNGLGDHPAALVAAERADEADEMVHSALTLPELVEAAVRCGRPERAARAVESLETQARATGTSWATGMAARSRALVCDGPTAEALFREAIEHLGRTRMSAHLARTRLLYGEWLRREGRRRDAREELRAAHDLLAEMGAKGFAARAAAELRATGEHPRTRSARPGDALTAQELRIARLVATGVTSKEAGAQLFLSPRTIDAHLRNIFPKLGITSRRELRHLRLD